MTEPSATAPAASWLARFSHGWRALGHRNFRLYAAGQMTSMTGTWMTRIAMAWLVYRLTKSPWMLGAVGFANMLPLFLFSPVAGVVIDRMDRRRLLTLTQALMMAHSLLLAALTLSHHINIPAIFVLSVVQGLVNTLDLPTRQSFMIRMVGSRQDLTSAYAIYATIMNIARLAGPSLGGLLVAATSEGWCFLVDGISFGAVIASLLMMRMEKDKPAPAHASVAAQLRQGWSYVAGSLPIRNMLLLFAVVCLLGWPFTTLMPIFAAQVLHGGPNTLGFLMGALGVGALGTAILLALSRSAHGLAEHIPWTAITLGAALILFGMSRRFWLSFVLLLYIGFCLIRLTSNINVIIQTLVEEQIRGRVMSYYTWTLEGLQPWGSLILGALASALGAPRTVMIGGSAVILGGLWFLSRMSRIRAAMLPTLEQLGIALAPSLAENPES